MNISLCLNPKNYYESVSDQNYIAKLMDAIRSEKDYRYKRSIKW